MNEIRQNKICDSIKIRTSSICDNYDEYLTLSENLKFKDSIFFMALYENNKKMLGHKKTLSELFDITKPVSKPTIDEFMTVIKDRNPEFYALEQEPIHILNIKEIIFT